MSERDLDGVAEDDGVLDPSDSLESDARSGRLVAPDEGAHEDDESNVFARDVGQDGGAASAEEAAVHVTDEPPFS